MRSNPRVEEPLTISALELARGALAALERSRRRIDNLNVYPVPDGDTGTNLTLTGRAIVEALEQSTVTERSAIAKELTRAALMGARGNSGVILSQIVRGFVEVAGDRPHLDVATVAEAFRSASDAAYRAVRKPVEGTMLTVIRELAESAERSSAKDVEELLVELVRAGEESVRGTTEKLDVLRNAGVVDAGGAGLVEILRGIASVVTGEQLPEAPPDLEEVGVDAIHRQLSDYRYCTTFVIEGENLARDELESEFERLGDSLLVVGDADAMKVHVHTDEPGAALTVGTKRGTIAGVEIANMHVQTMQREERLFESVPGAIEVVAVVAGNGNRRLFEGLGATRIVEGGQTMNPSTAELVAALEATGADAVILLPNNSNVIMSAEQAADLTSKDVHVIPSDSIPSGLAALVRFDGLRTVGENAAEMRAALEDVATGEVTVASRDAQLNGLAVRKGAYLGLADGEAVAVGESFEQVVADVVERLLERPRDVLTLLAGEGAPTLDGVVSAIGERHPDVEVDVQEGGQPHYPLLLSAE
jgi:DAK2 domain fusion protein YloV